MGAPTRCAGQSMSESERTHHVLDGFAPLHGPGALTDLFALTPGRDTWRNATTLRNLGGTMLGGHIAALALKAAVCSAQSGMRPAALHILFLAAPDPAQPCDIAVDSLRDGGRLAHRSVRIEQAGRRYAQAAVTLVAPALALQGPTFACDAPPPQVPDPEGLPTRAALRAAGHAPAGSIDAAILAGHPFLDIRLVPEPSEDGETLFWVRVPAADLIDPIDQLCLLALISDYWCVLPVHHLPRARAAMGRDFITTSLDHALWLHAPPDWANWTLFGMRAPAAGGGVAMMQARAWDRDGRAVATCVQQALLVPAPASV